MIIQDNCLGLFSNIIVGTEGGNIISLFPTEYTINYHVNNDGEDLCDHSKQ